jgi:hypothetical protein
MLAGKPVATPPLDPPPDSLPAANGAAIGESTWRALIHRSRPTFLRLLELQRPNGSFLTPTAKDNLESLWYHELVILHAFTAYALHVNDSQMLDAARRAATYHLNEIQPDHATTEPWGINAFLLHPDTWPLADQQLHTLQTQYPRGIDAVSAILLTDAAKSLISG